MDRFYLHRHCNRHLIVSVLDQLAFLLSVLDRIPIRFRRTHVGLVRRSPGDDETGWTILAGSGDLLTAALPKTMNILILPGIGRTVSVPVAFAPRDLDAWERETNMSGCNNGAGFTDHLPHSRIPLGGQLIPHLRDG